MSDPVTEPSTTPGDHTWLDQVRWNDDGLAPAVVQDAASGAVLMMAWMNREALAATLAEGRSVFWSRSRRRLWRKGEQSGNVQRVQSVRLDCDHDSILLRVVQEGKAACHTGRRSCYFHELRDGAWAVCEAPVVDPDTLYPNAGERG